MQALQPPNEGQPSQEWSVDSRAARSARTRRAIVDAMRALHDDGELRPTAPRIAERAGVSVRTVWQHFDDLETLMVEAGRRDLEIASGFVEEIDADLPVRERISALVDQRARMYEAMAPPWRAARLHAPFSAQIRANRDRMMDLARAQVAELFASEIAGCDDADTLLDALVVATGWATWESLRTDIHLDVEAARKALALWLSRLLSG